MSQSFILISASNALNLQACCIISPLLSVLAFKTRNRYLPITNKRVDPMVARAETSQLHLLPILNLLRVAISPFHRHFGVRICVDQDVERAIAGIELGQEGHGCCDLAEDGLDFELDLLLCLLRDRLRRVSVLGIRREMVQWKQEEMLALAQRFPCRAAWMYPWKLLS